MTALKIYFAGDLFDAKDLGGNLMLASAIERCSGGRYEVMLPQNGESEVNLRTSQSIRDADFELLYNCDLIVANFDGPDPDSGTVTEFCFAKMVDMPALLLRTDFRDSGDNTLPDGDPWNLMCSHYPRPRVLHINSMLCYQRCLQASAGAAEMLNAFYDSIAAKIIAELDDVVKERSWLGQAELFTQYKMAVKSIGGTMPERLDDTALQSIIKGKIESGLY